MASQAASAQQLTFADAWRIAQPARLSSLSAHLLLFSGTPVLQAAQQQLSSSGGAAPRRGGAPAAACDRRSMPFGQLVIGPPGSGKTTYVAGASAFLTAAGRRVATINLDPANDGLPYMPDVDVCELVCLESVMDSLGLGPNGGMLYCLDYLAANLDWLQDKLAPLIEGGCYLLFDCPGQVELFTQAPSLKAVVDALAASSALRLAVVHLVDAHLATDPAKYISALLLALSTMLHLELPQVNVLSKVDLLRQYGELAFNLEFYTQVGDLSYLVAAMEAGAPTRRRFTKLSEGLCELVEGYGLVAFSPLAIQDAASLSRLLSQVDTANGATYARLDAPPVPAPAELLVGAGHRAADDELVADLQERFVDGRGGSSRGHAATDAAAAAGLVAECVVERP